MADNRVYVVCSQCNNAKVMLLKKVGYWGLWDNPDSVNLFFETHAFHNLTVCVENSDQSIPLDEESVC